MTIRFLELDTEETRRYERQAEWRARSVAGLKQRRDQRLKTLKGQEPSIARALRAYAKLDEGSVPHINLRTGFIRLNPARPAPSELEANDNLTTSKRQQLLKADLDTRPPLTQLINRKSNSLQLYLTAIYVAHLEGKPGKIYGNRHRNALAADGLDSWSTLAGLAGSGSLRARRLRITRALEELTGVDLVGVGSEGTRDRFELFTLCREDGSHKKYGPPSPVASVVKLPAAFFVHGWHLVLDPKEIATFLAILEMTRGVAARNEEGSVALPEVVRWERYGLSGEAYESIHELEEFGLIDIYDPMPNRRRGKIQLPSKDERSAAERDEKSFEPVPYRFIHGDLELIFNRDARETVFDCLNESDIPPRLLS